jgi:FkbM family methyltransferase
MLIPFNECCNILKSYDRIPRGVLHIGAHECEELSDYMDNGINPKDIIWIDAIQEKVSDLILNGILNVYCVALDNIERTVNFNITNNGQSSSLLELGTHKDTYPYIHVVESREVKTQTLKNFIKNNNIDIEKCNFWNLDIQGKELDVLEGGREFLIYADAIYCEVNTEEVYKGCGTLDKLDEFLLSNSFIRVKLSMTDAGWGDALYIRV